MISFLWFGKNVQVQLKTFCFHHSEEFQLQSKRDVQCWWYNLHNLQVNQIKSRRTYQSLWICAGAKETNICHSGIFRFLCLFFLAPKVKQESVPWHIYSSCGCLGYHPVQAWPISNYAGAQRIKMISDFKCLGLISRNQILSNKSHKLWLWSDIRHMNEKSVFAKEILIGLWHVQRLLTIWISDAQDFAIPTTGSLNKRLQFFLYVTVRW